MEKYFRPDASHLATIGSELIKDQYAAIIELVKNSYDADAKNVWIHFFLTDKEIDIIIQDDGHGMSSDDVEFKWLVPSTKDKHKRRLSPNKRKMQGKKGIGRFASAILGNKLTLITINENLETKLKIDWLEFERVTYLDEVKFRINSSITTKENGTTFYISGGKDYRNEWGNLELDTLKSELQKTIAYIQDDFTVHFNFSENKTKPEGDDFKFGKKIEPLNLMDNFHYRIYGDIDSKGHGELNYESGNITDKIEYQFINPEGYNSDHFNDCGSLYVDFRVFDRDKESLEGIATEIGLFLKNSKPDYKQVGKLINRISGVTISRHGFIVRPYGEHDKDWLYLDKDRVQNPSMRVGFNQISGVVKIDSEDKSNLIEKSARDGLKENKSYNKLVYISKQVLSKLEIKRFEQKRKESKYQLTKRIITDKELKRLVDYSDVKSSIEMKFLEHNIEKSVLKEIENLIDEKIESDKIVLNKIEETIAEYQNQVTLGRMTNVLLHELSRPVGKIKNESSIIKKYIEMYKNNEVEKYFENIIISSNLIHEESAIVGDMIDRIKPFSLKKRSTIQKFSIVEEIKKSIKAFDNFLKNKEIDIKFVYDKKHIIKGWKLDFSMIVNNIIDNAIFWLQQRKNNRKIDVSISSNDYNVIIEISNNGPRISSELMEEGLLFVPGISEKPEGTGLGLAIVGEATRRIGGDVKVKNEEGKVTFIIEIPLEGVE